MNFYDVESKCRTYVSFQDAQLYKSLQICVYCHYTKRQTRDIRLFRQKNANNPQLTPGIPRYWFIVTHCRSYSTYFKENNACTELVLNTWLAIGTKIIAKISLSLHNVCWTRNTHIEYNIILESHKTYIKLRWNTHNSTLHTHEQILKLRRVMHQHDRIIP